MTPEGDVLYDELVFSPPRSSTWRAIGIWDPVRNTRHTLFGPTRGYYAGGADANARWADALYIHGPDAQHAPMDNVGWKLVVLDRQTGQTEVVARDTTGLLGSAPHRWTLNPLRSLWHSELVWTQLVGTPGHVREVLRLMNLRTHRTAIIASVAQPMHAIDQPSVHGPYVAYSIATWHDKPDPHYSETLVAVDWRTRRVLFRVPGGVQPAFDPEGQHVYFASGPVVHDVGVARTLGGHPAVYAALSGPPDSYTFWSPNVGQGFVTWLAEVGRGIPQWAKLRRTGQWVTFPVGSSATINNVATGGNVVAWSTFIPGYVAPDPRARLSIHAALAPPDDR